MAKGLPLSALLPDKLDDMGTRVRSRMCDDQRVGAMKLAWDFVGKQLEAALRSSLDCDLVELLAKGWAQSGALTDFAARGDQPPGQQSLVELGEHEVKHELHPTVAVTIAPCPCVDLKFTFAVAAHIGGANLVIVDGHIVRGEIGEAWASAELSYEGIPLHSPADSDKVKLPGDFAFAPPGIPIPLLAARKAAAPI